MNLLHIDSSISGESSVSRQLSAAVVAAFARAIPDLDVIRRDLDADAIPHLGSAASASGNDNAPDPLEEFLAADIVVIGAPMYNFSVPSQLKAWIDRILVSGKTFRYTEAGPVGLAAGKRVVIASSRGGLYGPGMPSAANDFQEQYLRAVFSFIGIEDVAFVRAEGLALGPDQRAAALSAALASVPAAVTGFVTRQAA